MFDKHIGKLEELAREKFNISLSKEQLDQFVHFGRLLLEWNSKINLTRITEPEEIIIKHFLDSLVVLPYLSGTNLCDIGTGAGFPGIPLAIARPTLTVTLVDSLGKRVDFLKLVGSELGLNIRSIHSRAEDFGRDLRFRDSFDAVVSRAVASLPVLAEYTLPLLKKGGYFFAYKGAQAVDEVRLSQKAFDVLGASFETVEAFNLGPIAEHRSLVIVRKTKETPKDYPRKAGQPEKKPLI